MVRLSLKLWSANGRRCLRGLAGQFGDRARVSGRSWIRKRECLAVGHPMEKAAAYLISAGIIAFGIWILIAGLGSGPPALWTCVAFVPVVIGLASAFGDW